MSKHTPGPWQVEGLTVYALNNTNVNRFSALVQRGWIDDEVRRTPNDELVANAALIAVAPDMASILTDFVEAWEAGAEFDTPTLRRFVRRMRVVLPDYTAPNTPDRA